MLLRQSLAELHLTKIGSDPHPVSDISNLCKDGVETILYPPAVLDAPSTTVFRCKNITKHVNLMKLNETRLIHTFWKDLLICENIVGRWWGGVLK